MKVLYVLANHPQLSEMYVESEINFVEKNGVETAVYSVRDPGAAYPVTRKVYRGETITLEHAAKDFKPDYVHFHWLTLVDQHLHEVRDYKVTARGHSFDFNVNRVRQISSRANVQNLFLFPHQAAMVKSDKVIAMPVGYDSSRYWYPGGSLMNRIFPEIIPEKNLKQVIRCCAARPNKGLTTFMEVAKMCPGFHFIICLAEVYGGKDFVKDLRAEAIKMQTTAEIRVNVTPDEMSQTMRCAGISFHTVDSERGLGQCISIAEGMASGNYSLVRNLTPFNEMSSDTYKDKNDAAALINATNDWTPEQWKAKQLETAIKAQQFADYNVFPTLLKAWK